jgi:PAS domain S-box-containing protein
MTTNRTELRPPHLFHLQERVKHVRIGVCIPSLFLLFCLPVWGQLGIPSETAASVWRPIEVAKAIFGEPIEQVTVGRRGTPIDSLNSSGATSSAESRKISHEHILQATHLLLLGEPSGSRFRFGGSTLWELHKWRLAALTLCVLEALLVMALLFERSRRSRADQARRLLEEKYANEQCFLAVLHDLTKRKESEEAIKKNEEWLQLAARSSQLGSWCWNEQTQEVLCDARAREMLCAPTDVPLTLKMFYRALHPDDLERVTRDWRYALESNLPLQTEMRVLRSDGSVRWIDLRGSTQHDEAGKTPLMVGVLFDITERKRGEQERQRSEDALRELTSQLIHSQEKERQRIAGELHDSLGQGLMIIKNRVLICLRDTTDRERVSEQLEEILTTVTATIEETRLISHNLRPYELDRLGLITAVQAMLDKISRSTSLRLSSDLDSVDGLLSREVEVGVYRIVQEGLTNVLKHAQATEARVTIKRAGAQLIVTVMDNGNRNGSHPGKAASNGAGFGLTGIAHRARMLGGTYDFRPVPDGGSVLRVTAEIHQAN